MEHSTAITPSRKDVHRIDVSPQRPTESNRAFVDKLLRTFPRPSRRILFVAPPETTEEEFRFDLAINKRYPCFPPYGCGLLAKKLKDRGYVTDIIDLNYELLADACRAETADRFNYGAWQDRLVARVTEFQPDVVCISCMFTMTHGSMKQIAARVKGHDSRIAIIAGGVHVTNATEMVLNECPEIDFAFKFEGDSGFPDLIDFVNDRQSPDKLVQLATIVDGEYLEIATRTIPSPDAIDTVPEYHELPIGAYDSVGQIGAYTFLRPARRASTVLFNRGCRARCSFCSVRSFNGPGVRGRSPQATVDEIERLADEHSVRHIMWLDDDLFYDHRQTVALFNEIVRRNLDITWDASNGVIAAATTDELMRSAVESGCIGLHWGVESGSPEILRAVHKPGTVETFKKAKAIVDRYPEVFMKGFLIIGFPNETVGQIMTTVKFAVDLALDWYPIQILTPLPSTEIHKTMIEIGLIEDDMKTGQAVSHMIDGHGNQVKFFNQAFATMRLREEKEKVVAEEFIDVGQGLDLTHVPTADELRDYWFMVDYKINYERLLHMQDKKKLQKIGSMLRDVVDRVTRENPLGNLFLGVIEEKLGNPTESGRRVALSETYVARSAYWQARFNALRLDEVQKDLRRKVNDAGASSGARAS